MKPPAIWLLPSQSGRKISCSAVTVYDHSFKSLLPHELKLLHSTLNSQQAQKVLHTFVHVSICFHQISLHIKHGIFMFSFCPALKMAMLTQDIICTISGSILSMPHILQKYSR
jgi:hypothetical protein